MSNAVEKAIRAEIMAQYGNAEGTGRLAHGYAVDHGDGECSVYADGDIDTARLAAVTVEAVRQDAPAVDDDLIESIREQVESEYGMGGLSDGLYGEYATDVARRYADSDEVRRRHWGELLAAMASHNAEACDPEWPCIDVAGRLVLYGREGPPLSVGVDQVLARFGLTATKEEGGTDG